MHHRSLVILLSLTPFSEDLNMVQLSPSPALDVSPPHECSEDGKGRQGTPKTGSPKMGSPAGLSSLQLALAGSTTTYPGYDMYIEDGLICIKHKIRNLEKKKVGWPVDR